MKRVKTLALDPGTKTIGVAISDPDCVIAFARAPIANSQTAIQEIITLTEEEKVQLIIIGKLFHEGKYAINKEFKSKLQESTDIEIIEFDEDYSTQQAIEQLKETGAAPSDIKEMKDSYAARVILERYINS